METVPTYFSIFTPMAHLIAPSILSADFGQLYNDVERINGSVADWIHCDVMDGHFVPNITFGFDVLKAIKKKAQKPLDVHLMIEKPEQYIERFAQNGADIITVHYEACTHLHRTIQQIKAAGIKAGVAINPHTTTALLSDILPDVDLVCIMSVNPGFGGQHFITNTYNKLEQLVQIRAHLKCSALFEIDGGVTLDNAASILKAGADVLVAGNTVFSNPDPVSAIAHLKNIPLIN